MKRADGTTPEKINSALLLWRQKLINLEEKNDITIILLFIIIPVPRR